MLLLRKQREYEEAQIFDSLNWITTLASCSSDKCQIFYGVAIIEGV